MIRRAWRPALAAAAASGVIACGTVLGLNDYGDAPIDASTGLHGDGGGEGSSTADDATTDAVDAHESRDGAADALGEADLDGGGSADDALSDGAAYDAPAGWTVVAFADTPDAGCPAGFTANPLSVVFDTATAASNACSCDTCSITTPPSCVTGTISGRYDLDQAQTCTTTAPALGNANAGACNTDNPHTGIADLDIVWTPLSATGGACAAPPTAHTDRVTFAGHGVVCSAAGDAGADANAVPSPFVECIATPGNVPCPPGPLGVQHLTGTGATLSCSGSCTCSVSGTCRNGVVTYYKNGTCGGGSLVMPADGQCNQVLTGASFSNTYGSYTYSATLSTMGCSANGTLSATVTGLAAEQTICCAQ